MDNSERLAAWRLRNSGSGAPARPSTQANSALAADNESALGQSKRERARAEQLEAERRRVEALLPSSVDLEQRRAELAEVAYQKDRSRLVRLTIFALLPLACALIYLAAFAPRYFRSDSTFTVMSGSEPGGAVGSGMISLGGAANLGDSYRIKEYLRSAEAMSELDKSQHFFRHFANSGDRSLGFYRDRVGLTVDQQEGLVSLRVDANTRADSVRFAGALLGLAEAKVRGISERINRDQLTAMEKEEPLARLRLATAIRNLQEVQIARNDIDPRKSAETIFSVLSQLETELAEQESQRAALLSNNLSESPLLPRISARIAALRSQIDRQEGRLVKATSGDTVQRSIALFDTAVAEKETAEAALKAARETLNQARLRGLEQRKYLVVIARPIAPETPARSRLFDVLLALAGALGLYICVRLWAVQPRRRAYE